MMKKKELFTAFIVLIICVVIVSDDKIFCMTAPVFPPLLAISLAFITKEVLISLFSGIWAGAFLYLLSFQNADVLALNTDSTAPGFLSGLFVSFLRVCDTYIVNSLADRDHVQIMIFTVMFGGMVAILSRSGGTKAIVDRLTVYAKTKRSGQFFTWLMGCLIFFDDYASCLLVGNTMRPLTDRLKISREKLSYIVDSTAAPVASLLFVSTWLGYEISLIGDAFRENGISLNPYTVFLQTIPSRFYPLFSIMLVVLTALTLREFGQMLKAEERVLSTGKLMDDDAVPLLVTEEETMQPPKGAELYWQNAAVPIVVLIFSTLFGLYWTGYQSLAATVKNVDPWNLKDIISGASSYQVLLWASFFSTLTAAVLPLFQGVLRFKDIFEAWMFGVKSMAIAVIILTLAWSLGAVCKDLKTAAFISGFAQNHLNPGYFPLLVFAVSCLMSFATGTSWGTMAIMIPIVVTSAHTMASGRPADAYENYLCLSLSSILAGAVFGDHCSPISDTTIMSSMYTGCDHMKHVQTQIPYAVTAATVSAVCLLFGGFGVPVSYLLLSGAVILFLIIFIAGKKPETVKSVKQATSRAEKRGCICE